MESFISVIIPAYNIEKYIARCLESVCRQTYSNLEIIVVDDGSSDNTGRIADDFAKKDKRITVIHKENAGVSAARNTGLDFAQGDYIGFVDGDDLIEPDMYELLIQNALKYQADISHCGYQMVFPDQVDYYHNTGEILVQDNVQGVYDLVKADKVEPGLWNKLYRKDLIGKSRLDENIRINEDLLFNYLLFKKANKSVFEDVPKYHYMIRANSAATSKLNQHKMEDPLLVLAYIMQREKDEIYCLLEKRYMYTLEKVSTLHISEKGEQLFKIQMQRKKELRQKLQRHELRAQYTSREMLQLKLAASSPMLYRMVHNVFATLSGSKNKYKV